MQRARSVGSSSVRSSSGVGRRCGWRSRVVVVVALAVLVGWVAPTPGGADVPNGLSYQGLLVDGEGAPLDGSLPVTLGIWDEAAPGGTLLYQESHESVDFADGVFQLVIGAGTASGSGVYPEFGAPVLAGADRYLEIAVDGEVLGPRHKLTSVGYALQCLELDGNSARDLDQSAHAASSSNPHGVTAAQAGAVTQKDIDAALDAFEEQDPQVGLLTKGQWCTASATAISCTQDPPAATDTNAGTLCVGASRVLNGDGDCVPLPVDTDTNAATLCGPGQVLTGDGYCTNANAHDHTATRTRAVSLGAPAFRPSQGTYMPQYFVREAIGAGFDTGVSKDARLVAAVELPDAATVTSMRVTVCDASADRNLEVTLKGWYFLTSSVVDLATISSTGSYDLQCRPYEVFNLDYWYDADAGSLSVWVSVTDDSVAGWVGDDLTIQSVVVTYTVER
jgi:hypothetical protein